MFLRREKVAVIKKAIITKIIRRGIFETNSSSSHSISVSKDSSFIFKKMLELVETKKDKGTIPLKSIQASTREYYDDGDILSTWQSKLEYILTSFQYFPGLDSNLLIKDKDYSWNYKYNFAFLEEHPFIKLLKEVVRDYANYDLYFDEEDFSTGSIDHDSTDIIYRFLEIKSVKDFNKTHVKRNLITLLFDPSITIALNGNH